MMIMMMMMMKKKKKMKLLMSRIFRWLGFLGNPTVLHEGHILEPPPWFLIGFLGFFIVGKTNVIPIGSMMYAI